MKIFSTSILILLCLVFCIQACSKDPSPVEKEETPSFGSVKNLEAFPGRNRVKLSFAIEDDEISYCEIFWNNKQQSRKINKSEAVQDTIKAIIDNLAEGNQSFEVFTYDRQNKPANASVKVTTNIYGDQYAASLENRTVASLYFIQNEEPYIDWGGPMSGEIALEVIYTQVDGQKKTIRTLVHQLSTVLAAYKPGTPIEYRSLHLPEKAALDTFYTAITRLPAPVYYTSRTIKQIVEQSGLVASVMAQSTENIHADIEYSNLQFESNEGQPLSLFILKADLSKDNVTLSTLMPNNGTAFTLQPVKTMAEHRDNAGGKVLAAVNADFFESTGVPWGPVFINGTAVRSVSKETYLSYFAMRKDGRPQTGIFAQVPVTEHANLRDVVGGGAQLLTVNGIRQIRGDQTPEPRTMVGYTSDEQVYLIVVDGRRPSYSAGITHDGQSAIMSSLKTFGSINLDGGGSSTMVIKRNGAFDIVNQYSDAMPRSVANGLAIIAK